MGSDAFRDVEAGKLREGRREREESVPFLGEDTGTRARNSTKLTLHVFNIAVQAEATLVTGE